MGIQLRFLVLNVPQMLLLSLGFFSSGSPTRDANLPNYKRPQNNIHIICFV